MILDTLLLPILINIACASFDGGAFLAAREFPGCGEGPAIVMPETGPVAIFTGPYPTVLSFALAGAAEVLVLTAVSYGLKRLHIKYWWAPQFTASGIHWYMGLANIQTHRRYMAQARERGWL